MREMKDSGVPWIGDIPKGWSLRRIGQMYKERRTKVSDQDFEPLSVTMKGVVSQLSTAAKTDAHDDRKLVKKGDFAINSRSDRRGSCGIAPQDGSVSLINTILCPLNETNSTYLNWLFHSTLFADEFYRWGHGIVDDLWTTNWSDMKRIYIPYPSLPEQQRIADFLDAKGAEIDSLMEITQVSIEEYKALKQSIITEAVTKGIRGNRPMKDSGIDCIGRIPAEWSIMKLRHIGRTQNGISKGAVFFGSGTPFVSYSDVYKNATLPKTVNGLILSTEQEQETFSVRYGDIFFTRTSETIEEIGFSSVCLKSIPKAVFAGFLIRLRPKDNTVLPDFSKYYFRSEIPRIFFVKEMNLVTRASLSQDLLKSLPVLVPPFEEQIVIAKYLDKKCKSIDALIESKEILLHELETYRKSFIYEYVTGKKEVPVREGGMA